MEKAPRLWDAKLEKAYQENRKVFEARMDELAKMDFENLKKGLIEELKELREITHMQTGWIGENLIWTADQRDAVVEGVALKFQEVDEAIARAGNGKAPETETL
jgi:class 3 adenylate cyclase